ncbi:MAG: adenylate kinase [Patescibacteria group bacterium]
MPNTSNRAVTEITADLSLNQLPKVIMFYGPPGSGKGTQANLIKDKYNIKFLDFGASFREFVAEHKDNADDPEQERAQRVYDYLMKGPILTEDLQYIIGKIIVDGVSGAGNFVMDKCGVLPEESEWLSDLLKNNQISSVLFHLPLDVAKSVERINHRYYVPGNKVPFGSYEEALKHCPEGIEPIRREGEDESHTLQRYDTMYRNNRDEILDIYRRKGHTPVIDINASLSIDEVHQQVINNLKRLAKQ